MINRDTEVFLAVLRYCCWNGKLPELAEEQLPEIYEEFKNHAITGLGAPALEKIKGIAPSVYERWRKNVYYQMVYFQKLKYCQDKLISDLKSAGVQAAILKGTAAAQYYPVPDYRTLGDIDLIVKREEFDKACGILLAERYREITDATNKERHREFIIDDITIELHRRFASLNSVEKAEIMDNYIVDSISENAYLPDPVNGLVILEHISQHMEGRIGLRQIIDWMYFVNARLDDDSWNNTFGAMADNVGMTVLAKTVTRMCVKYLGLRNDLKWCEGADERLCDDLMEYVLESGNFGCKRNSTEEKTAVKLTSYRNPVALLRHMQSVGLKEWDKAEKYRFLRPFAWVWKGFQLFRRAWRGNVGISVYAESRKRIRLLKELGVKENAKGIAYLVNGKYEKNKH